MSYYYDQRQRFTIGGGFTPAVKGLIIANVAMFVVQHLLGGRLTLLLGLVPEWIYTRFTVWQLFTYMFLHGGVFHIFFNMFVLWMFGSEVERYWGSKEFVKFYLLCGAGAGVCHVLFHIGSTIPVVGASGAIYGVMAAFAIMFPDRIVTLLLFLVLPVNIKAKHLVMFFAGLSLFAGVFGTQDGVAHFAHLGGMLVAFLYLKMGWKVDRVVGYMKKKIKSRQVVAETRRQKQLQRLRDEVDAILDKINEVGYENLTEKEKRILREASQFLAQEKEI